LLVFNPFFSFHLWNLRNLRIVSVLTRPPRALGWIETQSQEGAGFAMTELNHVADCTGSCSACPAVGSCPNRVVCRCLKVTEQAIIAAIRVEGARTIRELRTLTGAGDGCTCCHKELRQYLAAYSPSSSPLICSER
jgi:bacterioferritin-associated ferredoxin